MFTGQAEAELQLEMFEDMLAQREDILADLEEVTDTHERAGLRERLQGINEVLGYEVGVGEDALIDEWERDLEMGHVPDLDKKLR